MPRKRPSYLAKPPDYDSSADVGLADFFEGRDFASVRELANYFAIDPDQLIKELKGSGVVVAAVDQPIDLASLLNILKRVLDSALIQVLGSGTVDIDDFSEEWCFTSVRDLANYFAIDPDQLVKELKDIGVVVAAVDQPIDLTPLLNILALVLAKIEVAAVDQPIDLTADGIVGLVEALLFKAATRFYARNRDELLKDYEGKFVAILDDEVKDSDEDFEKLALRVYQRFGYRDIFMPKVERKPRTVRIPSPRLRA